MNDNLSAPRIGFVGLGNMGRGIASNLCRAGYRLMVYDASEQAVSAFEGACDVAASLDELFGCSDLLMLSLPGSPEVEAVVEKFLSFGAKGKTVIDLSTSYPYSSIGLHDRVKAAGGDFLDAPLAGGPRNAAEGTLTVMVGGEKDVYESVLPVLQSIAKSIFYIGGPGAGNIAKLASNYLSILYCVLYSEVLPFVEKLGVDPNAIFQVVGSSGSNSPIFQLVAPKIINEQYDLSFKMDLGIKDLSYMKRLFDENDAPSVMLDAGISLLAKGGSMGLGQHDISELARVIKDQLASKTAEE